MGVSNKLLLPAGLILFGGGAYYFSTQNGQSNSDEALEINRAEVRVEEGKAADLPAPVPAQLGASEPPKTVREEVLTPEPTAATEGLVRVVGTANFSMALPTDEQLFVMSLSRAASRQEIYRGPGGEKVGVSQLIWESGADAANTLLDGDIDTGMDLHLLSFAPVGAQGRFELKVGGDAKVLHLALAGRYSYSNGSTPVRVGEEATLSGELGAWITGELHAPGGLTASPALDDVEVALLPDLSAGFSAQQIQSVALEIRESADASGRFEFRSVPTEYVHGFFANSESYGAVLLDGLDGIRLSRGGHHAIEATLEDGASLSGIVMDEFMRPVTGGSVKLRIPGAAGRALGDLRETEIAEDGTFELAHVLTGMRLELTADPAGYLPGKEFVKSTLRSGDVLEEILIQVKRGSSLAGRVLFSDGTPAEHANVSLRPDFSGVEPAMIGDIAASFRAKSAETDAKGKFELTGLGAGPFKLIATLKEEEGPREGIWSAMEAGLKGEEQDLELRMESLAAMNGIVTTESAIEIGELDVRMTLKGSGGIMGIGAESKQKAVDAPGEEGLFQVLGVETGVWEVTLTAEGFSATEKVEVGIPQVEGEPLPKFVLHPSSSVSGIVFDEKGSPISGATVTLELDMAGMMEAGKSGGAPKTFSDHEGKYHLKGLTPGSQSVHATMSGYAPSEVRALDLEAGETVSDVQLSLRVGGWIVGEVFDKEGEPASGRTIVVQPIPAYNEQHITESDRDGRFRVEHLQPGQWQVIAMVNMMDGSLDTSDGKGTTNMMESMLMEMATIVDGEETKVILGAAPADPLALTGRVLSDGKPVPDALVVLRSAKAEGAGGMLMSTTDAQGTFKKTLANRGSYLVTIQTGVSTGLQNSIEQMVEIPEGVTEHQLTIELPLGGIAGTVFDANGKPAVNCRVTMHVGDGISYGSFLGGHYTEMVTDKKGNYSVEYLAAGIYDLSAGGSTLGGLMGDDSELGRLTRTGIVVAEGEWVRGIDFKLKASCELSGKVKGVDGNPVAGAAVFVRDENGLLVDRFSFVTTNASGKFTYTGLAEGRYRVTAKKEERVSASSEEVRVAAGVTTNTEVQLGAGTMLLVSVTDESGSELRPKVSVRDEKGEEWAGVLSVEQIMAELGLGFSEKEQRVGPLPPGKYYVVATLDDGRTARKVVTLDGQTERKARLRLK